MKPRRQDGNVNGRGIRRGSEAAIIKPENFYFRELDDDSSSFGLRCIDFISASTPSKRPNIFISADVLNRLDMFSMVASPVFHIPPNSLDCKAEEATVQDVSSSVAEPEEKSCDVDKPPLVPVDPPASPSKVKDCSKDVSTPSNDSSRRIRLRTPTSVSPASSSFSKKSTPIRMSLSFHLKGLFESAITSSTLSYISGDDLNLDDHSLDGHYNEVISNTVDGNEDDVCDRIIGKERNKVTDSGPKLEIKPSESDACAPDVVTSPVVTDSPKRPVGNQSECHKNESVIEETLDTGLKNEDASGNIGLCSEKVVDNPDIVDHMEKPGSLLPPLSTRIGMEVSVFMNKDSAPPSLKLNEDAVKPSSIPVKFEHKTTNPAPQILSKTQLMAVQSMYRKKRPLSNIASILPLGTDSIYKKTLDISKAPLNMKPTAVKGTKDTTPKRKTVTSLDTSKDADGQCKEASVSTVKEVDKLATKRADSSGIRNFNKEPIPRLSERRSSFNADRGIKPINTVIYMLQNGCNDESEGKRRHSTGNMSTSRSSSSQSRDTSVVSYRDRINQDYDLSNGPQPSGEPLLPHALTNGHLSDSRNDRGPARQSCKAGTGFIEEFMRSDSSNYKDRQCNRTGRFEWRSNGNWRSSSVSGYQRSMDHLYMPWRNEYVFGLSSRGHNSDNYRPYRDTLRPIMECHYQGLYKPEMYRRDDGQYGHRQCGGR
ncbi:hypothetical protein BBOV_III006590 [Babesia bovis T2Bo]|uniref:Uncharacterized protein n=1 Tax=Babesia bovis TaxID=5865 RepID=A7ANT6_BABBO|nr:hypothetical protein BBOV_III006590 [Babesia bovis T2Bo]EDO08220.1 hypothetical protein BBOV_III006590 [Babesia bovis T2Bo]|eukprot:XP_001611788.1 hypothetical protein [Babesia bovis T2Bo]